MVKALLKLVAGNPIAAAPSQPYNRLTSRQLDEEWSRRVESIRLHSVAESLTDGKCVNNNKTAVSFHIKVSNKRRGSSDSIRSKGTTSSAAVAVRQKSNACLTKRNQASINNSQPELTVKCEMPKNMFTEETTNSDEEVTNKSELVCKNLLLKYQPTVWEVDGLIRNSECDVVCNNGRKSSCDDNTSKVLGNKKRKRRSSVGETRNSVAENGRTLINFIKKARYLQE